MFLIYRVCPISLTFSFSFQTLKDAMTMQWTLLEPCCGDELISELRMRVNMQANEIVP